MLVAPQSAALHACRQDPCSKISVEGFKALDTFKVFWHCHGERDAEAVWSALSKPYIYLTGTAMPQINKINEEKRSIMDQLEDAERQLKKRDEDNARLRRELDMLRDEVRSHGPDRILL